MKLTCFVQILRAAFFDSDNCSEEILLQPINFDDIDKSDTFFEPDSEGVDDTSGDLFHEEIQNVSNINHDSVIIPETQFDPDDSNNSDTSCFLNEHYKSICSTIAVNSKSSVDNESESNAEENGDFFKVAADPNDCEPRITSLESQPIMTNMEKILLENFLYSGDSSSALSSTCIDEDVSQVAKQNGQTSHTNTESKADNNWRRAGEWSGSTTPDIDFEEIDKFVDKTATSAKTNTTNQTIGNTDNALMDTEDVLAACSQTVLSCIPRKEKSNRVTLVENGENQDKVVENDNDDVFDALTQKMPTTATEPTFAKPMDLAKKRKSIVPHNDSGN